MWVGTSWYSPIKYYMMKRAEKSFFFHSNTQHLGTLVFPYQVLCDNEAKKSIQRKKQSKELKNVFF